MTSEMPALPDPEKLLWFKNFRPHFEEWVILPAQRLIDFSEGMPAFVWITCSIDWLAGFWWGESTKNQVRRVYIDFISEYFPKDTYDAESLYDSLRNGLVHLYSIKEQKYALTHRDRDKHLKPNKEGYILLNLENFFEDFIIAKNSYFDAVEKNQELLDRAYQRYKRDGFLELVPITLE